MARGWIAPSEKETELARHVEGTWGPSRKEKLMRRMALAVVLVMMFVMAVFVTMVTLQTHVEENYAVVYSAPNEMYIGQLQLEPSAWSSFKEATTLTLTFTIPDWNVSVTRDLVYFNRTSNGDRLDYLRMAPITGQVLKDVSSRRVAFSVRITIETPHAEVAKMKFLGDSNHIDGTVTNHPDRELVELEFAGKGVVLVNGKSVEVRNDPKRDDVEYWFLQFTRTKLS